MGLLDQLKELQEKAPESSVDSDEIFGKEEDVDLEKEASAPEEEPEDDIEDEDGPEEEEAKEEKPEVKGYQGRKVKEFEKRAQEAQERADRLEAQLLAISSKLAEPRREEPQQAKEKQQPVPDRYEDPDGWVEHMLRQGVEGSEKVQKELQALKLEQTYATATAQLTQLENEYKQKTPDYDDVVKFGMDREIKREMALNPRANEAEIRTRLNRERVELAARFMAQGKDPVASIHNFMVEVYGYQPKEVKKQSKEVANLEAVKKNKVKGVSGLNAGGRSSDTVEVGPDAARKMSLAQFSKLSPAEKERAFANKR